MSGIPEFQQYSVRQWFLYGSSDGSIVSGENFGKRTLTVLGFSTRLNEQKFSLPRYHCLVVDTK